MDPVIEEMRRARDQVRPGFVRVWADRVQVLLDEKDAEIAKLTAQLDEATAPKKGKAA